MSKPRFESYIRNKSRSLVHENWTPSEAAKQFNVDYRNMCAYLAGRKTIPISLCFDILDYLGCNIVVFRTK